MKVYGGLGVQESGHVCMELWASQLKRVPLPNQSVILHRTTCILPNAIVLLAMSSPTGRPEDLPVTVLPVCIKHSLSLTCRFCVNICRSSRGPAGDSAACAACVHPPLCGDGRSLKRG
jgi:hypothetical protein